MNKKLVLIREQFELEPALNEGFDDGAIYLKAPVAYFGKKNGNQRIYNEENYLPLLEELQQKIKTNNLTGELDHPNDRFSVRLSNASHKIVKLEYKPKERMVEATIRLIEGTTAGNNAIALYKAGVKLGISSRAAGIVKEDGTAQLRKIFTYDIVSVPGFSEAFLEPATNVKPISENMAIFEITDESNLQEFKYLLEEDDNNDIMENKVNEALEQYKSKFDEFEKSLNELKSNISGLLNKNESDADVDKKINEALEKIDLIDKAMNKFINSLNEYSIQESSKLNSLVSYVDKQFEKLNLFVEHSDNQADKLNLLVEHIDNQANKLNKYLEFDTERNKKLNYLVDYVNEQAEKLNMFMEYDKERNRKFELLVEWAEQNFEKLFNKEEVKESINSKVKVSSDLSKISEAVDQILENARKTKAIKEEFGYKYSFLDNLDEQTIDRFVKLDKSRKTMVVKALNESKTVTAEMVNEAIDKALQDESITQFKWLVEAPEEYKNKWAFMNESEKGKIVKLAEMRDFKSAEDITNFWNSLAVGKSIQINESVNPDLDIDSMINEAKQLSNEWKLGYSKAYIEAVKEQIRKNKF